MSSHYLRDHFPRPGRLLAALLAASMLLTCHVTFVPDDPDREVRTLSEFAAVSVSSRVDLYLDAGYTPASTVAIHVWGEPGALHRVVTRVVDDTLVVGFDAWPIFGRPPRAAADIAAIHGVALRDWAWLSLTGLQTPALDVVAVDRSGGWIRGAVDEALITTKDRASLDMREVRVRDAYVELAGRSWLSICPLGSISGTVSGESTLELTCQPQSTALMLWDDAMLL